MGKLQPSSTREFKQQAVQLFETSGKTKTPIARDLGISESALNKWCKEFGEKGEEAFPGKGHQTTIEEEKRGANFSVSFRLAVSGHVLISKIRFGFP
jgi:transposase